MTKPPPLRATRELIGKAAAEWGFNCGPAAVCAVLGKTPDELRPHLGDFERKRYTNPSLMLAALRSFGVPYQCTGPDHEGTRQLDWPEFGLVRIQWGGPWTKPGVPIQARYRQTHWVATCNSTIAGRGIYDVNAACWISLAAWRNKLVPWLLREAVPKADGTWWLTHSVEVVSRA